MRKRNVGFSVAMGILKKDKRTFSALISKNSQKIIIDGKKQFFSEKQLNFQVFNTAKLIKNETKDFILNNTKFQSRENRRTIRYYNYNTLPEKLKRFYYIDISSCYISILKNNKIISKELFDKINLLKKTDRLISLGMLAYEPTLISFIEGIQQKTSIKVSNEYSPVFYTACHLTEQLMNKIIALMNGEYLFYWVDGIFFENVYHYNLIKDFLRTNNFKFSFGSCFNFQSRFKENYYEVSFMQKEKGKLNFKDYSIPSYFQQYEESKLANNLILKGDFDKLHEHYKTIINKTKTNY